jgi:hypothetical protein
MGQRRQCFIRAPMILQVQRLELFVGRIFGGGKFVLGAMHDKDQLCELDLQRHCAISEANHANQLGLGR